MADANGKPFVDVRAPSLLPNRDGRMDMAGLAQRLAATLL